MSNLYKMLKSFFQKVEKFMEKNQFSYTYALKGTGDVPVMSVDCHLSRGVNLITDYFNLY